MTGILGALSLCLPPAQADLAEDAGGFLLTCKGPPAEKCRWAGNWKFLIFFGLTF